MKSTTRRFGSLRISSINPLTRPKGPKPPCGEVREEEGRESVTKVAETRRLVCRNCGECCGIIPVTRDEWRTIKGAVAGMPQAEQSRLSSQRRPRLTCPFRDTENRRCSIYRVRPLICQMQGFYAGLECPNASELATGTREKGGALLASQHGRSLVVAGILGITLGWEEAIKPNAADS